MLNKNFRNTKSGTRIDKEINNLFPTPPIRFGAKTPHEYEVGYRSIRVGITAAVILAVVGGIFSLLTDFVSVISPSVDRTTGAVIFFAIGAVAVVLYPLMRSEHNEERRRDMTEAKIRYVTEVLRPRAELLWSPTFKATGRALDLLWVDLLDGKEVYANAFYDNNGRRWQGAFSLDGVSSLGAISPTEKPHVALNLKVAGKNSAWLLKDKDIIQDLAVNY